MVPFKRVLIGVSALLLVVSPVQAASNSLTLVSKNAAQTSQGNGGSSEPSISADGNLIVFQSDATNLTIDEDDNGRSDVFLYNVETDTMTLVTQALDGVTAANGVSESPRISADGSTIAFLSSATNLTTDTDTNSTFDLFLYDVATGATTLVTKNADGNNTANDSSGSPSISADGSRVVFSSRASNLTPDTHPIYALDVFLYDATLGTIDLISTKAGDDTTAANGASDEAVISADGSTVVFRSEATDMFGAIYTSGTTNIFQYKVNTGILALISRFGLNAGNGFSSGISVSANGSRIAFETTATNLTSDIDYNGQKDVLLFQTNAPTLLTLVSAVTAGGQTANDSSTYAVISADGSRVTGYRHQR